jgi:hypothetical protein
VNTRSKSYPNSSNMNVKVVRIIKDLEVEFSTKKGNGIGTWFDEVEVGKVYGIEFDIYPMVKIGDNAQRTADKTYFIRHDNNVNEIQVEKFILQLHHRFFSNRP